MSTKNIYGEWSKTRTLLQEPLDQELQTLWDNLAAHEGRPNMGISQRKNEITELWKLFRLQNPKTIVEVGVAQGGTFAGWCQLAADDAVIIGIDRCVNDCRPRPGDPVPSLYNGPLSMTEQGGGMYSLRQRKQQVHAVNGWTYETRTINGLMLLLAGRKIDFLFPDASHEAKMFARDFETFWPLIADGGIFASHDVMTSADPNCNKKETWDQIKRTTAYSACYEYLPHPSQTEMGIGVLIK